MTDRDLRTVILEYLYEHRDAGWLDRLTPERLGIEVSQNALTRVLFHLKELALVGGIDVRNADGRGMIDPEISPWGVDVIEGSTPPPIALNIDNSVTVSGGSVQVGDSNTQTQST